MPQLTNNDLMLSLPVLDFQAEEREEGEPERFSGSFVENAVPVDRMFFRVQFRTRASDWNLSRVENGVAGWSLEHGNVQVGVIEEVSFRNNKGRFTGRFVEAISPDVMQAQANIRNGDLKGISMEIGMPEEVVLIEEDEDDSWNNLYEFRGMSLDGITSTMRPAFQGVGVNEFSNTSNHQRGGKVLVDDLPDIMKQAVYHFREENKKMPEGVETQEQQVQPQVATQELVTAPEGMVTTEQASQMFTNMVGALREAGVLGAAAISESPEVVQARQEAEAQNPPTIQQDDVEFTQKAKSVGVIPKKFAEHEQENVEKRGSNHFAMGEYLHYQMKPHDKSVQEAAAGEIRQVKEQETYTDPLIEGSLSNGWDVIPMDAVLSFVMADPHRVARLPGLVRMFSAQVAGTPSNASAIGGAGNLLAAGTDITSGSQRDIDSPMVPVERDPNAIPIPYAYGSVTDLIRNEMMTAGTRQWTRWLSNFAEPSGFGAGSQNTTYGGPTFGAAGEGLTGTGLKEGEAPAFRTIDHDRIECRPVAHGLATSWSDELMLQAPSYRTQMMVSFLEGWLVAMDARIFAAFYGTAGGTGDKASKEAPHYFAGHSAPATYDGKNGGFLDPALIEYDGSGTPVNYSVDKYWVKFAANLRRYFRERRNLNPNLTMFVEPVMAELLETAFTNSAVANDVALMGGRFMGDIPVRVTDHFNAYLNIGKGGVANKTREKTGAAIMGDWSDILRLQWGGLMTKTDNVTTFSMTKYYMRAFEDYVVFHDRYNVKDGSQHGHHGWFARIVNDQEEA